MVFTLSWNKSQPWLAAKSCAGLRLCMILHASDSTLSRHLTIFGDFIRTNVDSDKCASFPSQQQVLSLEIQARWVGCAALILATDENLVPCSHSFYTPSHAPVDSAELALIVSRLQNAILSSRAAFQRVDTWQHNIASCQGTKFRASCSASWVCIHRMMPKHELQQPIALAWTCHPAGVFPTTASVW